MSMGPLQKEGSPVLVEGCVVEQVEIPWVKPNQTLVHSRCQRISSTPKMETISPKLRKTASDAPSQNYSCTTKIEAQHSLLFLSNCQEYMYMYNLISFWNHHIIINITFSVVGGTHWIRPPFHWKPRRDPSPHRDIFGVVSFIYRFQAYYLYARTDPVRSSITWHLLEHVVTTVDP